MKFFENRLYSTVCQQFNIRHFRFQMFYNNFYMSFAETDQLTHIQIVYPHFTCNMSHFFCLNYASGFDSRNVLGIIFISKAL